MQSWVRRSLETAVITAGFVAVGAGAAHASTPGKASSDVTKLALPGLSGSATHGTVQDAVHSTKQIVSNTVDVLSPQSPLTPRAAAPTHQATSTKSAPAKRAVTSAPAKAVVKAARRATTSVEHALPKAAPVTHAAPVTEPAAPATPAAPHVATTPEVATSHAAPAHTATPHATQQTVHPVSRPQQSGGLLGGLPGLDSATSLLQAPTNLVQAPTSALQSLGQLPAAGSVLGQLPAASAAPKNTPETKPADTLANATSGPTNSAKAMLGNLPVAQNLTEQGLNKGVGTVTESLQPGAAKPTGELSAAGKSLPLQGAGLPVAPDLGIGPDGGLTPDPSNPVQTVTSLANARANLETASGHEIELLDAGVQPRTQVGQHSTKSGGALGDIEAPLHLTAAAIDSGRNSQNGTIDQEYVGSGNGSRILGSVDMPVDANVLTVDSGNNSQNGAVSQTLGDGHGIAGLVNVPINAHGMAVDTGNNTQNGDVSQFSDNTGGAEPYRGTKDAAASPMAAGDNGDGSAFRLVDDLNLPVNASGQAFDTGNSAQNGDVDQALQDNTTSSGVNLFGNANTPLNGAGQAGDIGNASQNGDISQLDQPSGNPAFVSLADNLNIPATGAGQAGVVGNAAQNGDVSQANFGPNDPPQSYDNMTGFGSAVNLFRNVRVPIDGAGQAGVIGNAAQNGDVSQVDEAGSPGSAVSIADNAVVQGAGAGQAGDVANGAQNGNVDQSNTNGEGSNTPDKIQGWGSAVNLFRNLDIPLNGAGQGGVSGNGSQNGNVSQSDDGHTQGSAITAADNIAIPVVGVGQGGDVGNGAQNGNKTQTNSQGHGWVNQDGVGGWGESVNVFRNIYAPLNGAGQGGVSGNGSQNGNATQTDSHNSPGSSITIADNGIIKAVGVGQGGVVGDGSQNGNTTQTTTGKGGVADDVYGWGSEVKLFRNLDSGAIGVGQGGDVGNGAQNGNRTQFDSGNNPGSQIGIADNAIFPINGAGQGGASGNGAQNGDVHQRNWTDNGTLSKNGDARGFGSQVELLRNADIPVVGVGQGGLVGNGAQNQVVNQNDSGRTPGSSISVGDNVNVPLNGAGQGGDSGNGSQNGKVDQNNSSGLGSTTDPVTSGWGSSLLLFRNINIPAVGVGQGADVGNGTQNQLISQDDTASNPGSRIGVGDNVNLPVSGAGQAGDSGNGSQNGGVTQLNNEDPGYVNQDGDSAGYGSEFRLFRNLNLPLNGSGWAIDHGNGSQNGYPVQVDTKDNNGESFGFADNLNVPVLGSFAALSNGNGDQNGNPTQLDAPTQKKYGSDVDFADNINVPVVGNLVAIASGNGAENGNPFEAYLGSPRDFKGAGTTNLPIDGNLIALAEGNGMLNESPSLTDTPTTVPSNPLVDVLHIPAALDGFPFNDPSDAPSNPVTSLFGGAGLSNTGLASQGLPVLSQASALQSLPVAGGAAAPAASTQEIHPVSAPGASPLDGPLGGLPIGQLPIQNVTGLTSVLQGLGGLSNVLGGESIEELPIQQLPVGQLPVGQLPVLAPGAASVAPAAAPVSSPVSTLPVQNITGLTSVLQGLGGLSSVFGGADMGGLPVGQLTDASPLSSLNESGLPL